MCKLLYFADRYVNNYLYLILYLLGLLRPDAEVWVNPPIET
ncbi:MAG TPA: hypothetical protein VFT72_06865 [Opitutaceae bacterium]|nr:hypothetical protein [Opitutaceae bacterium]